MNCKWFTFSRSEIISLISLLILSSILLSYFIFLLIEYNNPNYNSKTTFNAVYNQQYTYPWVFIEWQQTNPDTFDLNATVDCNLQIAFNSGLIVWGSGTEDVILIEVFGDNQYTMVSALEKFSIVSKHESIDFGDAFIDLKTILTDELITNQSDKFVLFYESSAVNTSAGGTINGGSGYVLLVPPSTVAWNNTMSITRFCSSSDESWKNTFSTRWLNTEQVMFQAGHRDTLLSLTSSSLYQYQLNNDGIIMTGGILTYFEFSWYYIHDKINNIKSNFYDFGAQGSFYLNQLFSENSGNTYTCSAAVELRPNAQYVKNEWITDELFGWTDILSNIGGMYSTVAAILTPLFLYIIWGYESGVITIKSADSEAEAQYVEAQKFKSLMKQYGFEMIKKQLQNAQL